MKKWFKGNKLKNQFKLQPKESVLMRHVQVVISPNVASIKMIDMNVVSLVKTVFKVLDVDVQVLKLVVKDIL